MSEELKPCPFCGKTPHIQYYAGSMTYRVICTWDCNGNTSSDSGKIAVDAWNTRVSPPETNEKELREALKEAIDLVRMWHGMGMHELQEKQAWKIYFENAPEMKRIREAQTYLARKEKESEGNS